MQYTRRASAEGWRVIATVAITVPLMILATFLFSMNIAFSIVFTVFILLVSGLALAYAIGNIRTGGMFICRLTDEDFIQIIPDRSCGDSFHVKLTEITKIECHEAFGEGPSDEWYLHTKDGRHRITINYGNPYRRFSEALQKALPEVETIQT